LESKKELNGSEAGLTFQFWLLDRVTKTSEQPEPDSVGKAHLTHVFVGPLVGADCGGQSGEGQVVGAFGSWERSACSCRMLGVLGTHETDAAYVPEISAFVHQSMC